MKFTTPLILLALLLVIGCKPKQQENEEMKNPFFEEWNTPFAVPPFELIKNEHFMPAFEEGMKQQSQEIAAIVNNTETPTFQNTIEAMDYSGKLLRNSYLVFDNLTSANTNDTLQAIAKEAAPKLSEHYDNIYLDEKLFSRVKAVYDQRESLNLDPEQMRLVEERYKDFEFAGANLDSAQKEQLRAINKSLSTLTLEFGDNLLAETNDFQMVVDNEADLDGLPASLVQAAAKSAKDKGLEGKWAFGIQKPTLIPFLQYSTNRDLRRQMFLGYIMKGDNGNKHDNKVLINEIVNLRLQKAQLLGFDNWASMILSRNMAKETSNVFNFLNELMTAATTAAKLEVVEMQKIIDSENGGFNIEPWDWWYYAEKVRQSKYDLDEEALRPYFKLENVRDGVFELVNRLFGLQMKRNNDIPTYHPEVEAYEVLDSSGAHIGVLFMDFFPRPSKQGGAWMSEYRGQYKEKGEMVTPVITTVFNFTRPTSDKPALLNFDEVETLFHEFGHALHGLLSNCTYPSLAGTNVTRDFVELPSQIMENWCSEPEMLRIYAHHFETGEVIPEELIQKIQKSSFFNQGFEMSEYMAASLLDIYWHTIQAPYSGNPDAFESEWMNKIGLIKEIVPRYRSTYFAHIFSGGYSAGYYSYVWAQVLDADAFAAFKEHGIFDKATATSFRNNILSKGNTADPMELYIAFRGKEPNKEALLRRNGIIR